MEIELGALRTTGNTEDENIKYKLGVGWLRGNWDYRAAIDGLRSSKNDELSAQRQYRTAEARYALSDDSFVMGRLAYENDRFSGYDSQSYATVSYGRNFYSNTATWR